MAFRQQITINLDMNFVLQHRGNDRKSSIRVFSDQSVVPFEGITEPRITRGCLNGPGQQRMTIDFVSPP